MMGGQLGGAGRDNNRMAPEPSGWNRMDALCANTFDSDLIDTPAFVYDEGRIVDAAKRIGQLASSAGCRPLYTLKPFLLVDALRLLVGRVDGFAASSVFEATLARSILGMQGTVHLTTPGLRPEELAGVRESCDYVAFNSLSQWARLQPLLAGPSSGLRVNPQLSFVADQRYDPCGRSSRLGVPLDELARVLATRPELLEGLDGLHFHSNCDSDDLSQLLRTVLHIQASLGSHVLDSLRWVNMGGGYLFDSNQKDEEFHETVQVLGGRHGLEVFIEPGAAMVREAGYVVSTVVDLIETDVQRIAVLDTTVNHMPEVFEFQFEPDVLGHSGQGAFEYSLAGCSCLAGDVFGQYCFDVPLCVGSRVVFAHAGAYTLVKAHMFNGINLPTVYARTHSGEFVLKRRFSYSDFTSRCGAGDS